MMPCTPVYHIISTSIKLAPWWHLLNRMIPIFLHIPVHWIHNNHHKCSGHSTEGNVLEHRYNEVVIYLVKSQISVIWGFKVSAVEIISQIHRTFLVDSVLSVITYKQIARRSSHNSVGMSASTHGAGRAESNASAWLTASEISVLRCTAPQIFDAMADHTKCSQ